MKKVCDQLCMVYYGIPAREIDMQSQKLIEELYVHKVQYRRYYISYSAAN